jgi:3-deoxy-D-manno-octulosonic-acid transferase
MGVQVFGCSGVQDAQPEHLNTRTPEHLNTVLLLDTMGELARFFGLAAVAFVGGSLVPRGGHDLLQPLFHGVPTLFGPYVHNQRTLAELALGAGAACQVADASALAEALIRILAEGEARATMRAAAARLLAENRGASARCAAVIADLIRSGAGNSPQRSPTGVGDLCGANSAARGPRRR